MSLTRTTLGLEALHVPTARAIAGVTTAFNAANWTGQNIGTGTITVDANGRLLCGIGAVSGVHAFRYSAMQAQADCCVMAVFNTVNVASNVGLLARLSDEASPLERLTATVPIVQGAGGTFLLSDTTGGGASGSSTAAGNRGLAAPMARAVLTAGATAQAWMEAPNSASPLVGGGTANLTLTNIDASGSWAGIGMTTGVSSTGTLTVSEFCLLRNRLLTVTGPTTGNWRVRLKNANGTIIALSDVQVGGTATIDILGNSIWNLYTWLQRDPNYAVSGTELSCISAAASIEIYDDDTTTVVQAPVSPSERVWPGDAWSWVPSVWPPAPTTLTRTTSGRLFAFSANATAGFTNPWSPFDWANGVGYSDSVRIDAGGANGLLAFRFSGTNFRPLLMIPLSRNHTDIWLRARPEQRAGTAPSISTASINARGVNIGASNLAGLNGVPSALGGSAANSGVYERSTASGAPVVQSSVQSTTGTNTPLDLDLLVIGTTVKYMQSSPAGFTEKTLTGVAAGPGDVYLGESGANNVVLRWNTLSGERSNLVLVQGLSPSTTVDILNVSNTVIASGTADALGVASIDLRAASVAAGAARSVRINDGVTPVATPADGVWGGDVWVFASPSGNAARAVRRKFGARNLLLKR